VGTWDSTTGLRPGRRRHPRREHLLRQSANTNLEPDLSTRHLVTDRRNEAHAGATGVGASGAPEPPEPAGPSGASGAVGTSGASGTPVPAVLPACPGPAGAPGAPAPCRNWPALRLPPRHRRHLRTGRRRGLPLQLPRRHPGRPRFNPTRPARHALANPINGYFDALGTFKIFSPPTDLRNISSGQVGLDQVVGTLGGNYAFRFGGDYYPIGDDSTDQRRRPGQLSPSTGSTSSSTTPVSRSPYYPLLGVGGAVPASTSTTRTPHRGAHQPCSTTSTGTTCVAGWTSSPRQLPAAVQHRQRLEAEVLPSHRRSRPRSQHPQLHLTIRRRAGHHQRRRRLRRPRLPRRERGQHRPGRRRHRRAVEQGRPGRPGRRAHRRHRRARPYVYEQPDSPPGRSTATSGSTPTTPRSCPPSVPRVPRVSAARPGLPEPPARPVSLEPPPPWALPAPSGRARCHRRDRPGRRQRHRWCAAAVGATGATGRRCGGPGAAPPERPDPSGSGPVGAGSTGASGTPGTSGPVWSHGA
jgi:hypothetical protein